MKDLHIAYIQADIYWENVPANLKAFDKRFEQISATVDLVLLPETFNTGFSPNVAKFAEPMTGQTMQWMQEKAKETNAVVAGSLVIAEKDYMVNRFVWVRPDGGYDFYDKKHLFLLSQEARVLKHGEELKTFELYGWRIRPFVCYDLRFPCWIRNNFQNNEFEYDLALFVASWPLQRAHVWRTLLQARAIENQAYVIGVNRIGVDGLGDIHVGDCMAISAFGEVISKPTQGVDCITEVILYKKVLTDFRERFKVAADWDKFTLL